MVVVLVLESKVLYWSFSPEVTAWRMFVYKKNPVGFELYSHVKTFYYSKQFAKLLTTWQKTIYWCFWHNDKRRVLKSHCCFLTFLFQNRRGGRGRPVIPLPFYKEREGGGGRGWGLASMEPLPWVFDILQYFEKILRHSKKPFIFPTRWAIFYGSWCCWRPVASPEMVAILNFSQKLKSRKKERIGNLLCLTCKITHK